MPDWTKSMEQSYEYYTVEPDTLADVKRLVNVKSSSFSRDLETETLGSATIDSTNSVGESYIRCYLKTIQNGKTEKHALGTVLVQTPSSTFDGKIANVSMDAYTPLIELKENRPPLGYTVRKGTRIMEAAYNIICKNARAPVNQVERTYTTNKDGVVEETTPMLQHDFVANVDDTWLSFVIDLIANAQYELGLDEYGHILFLPVQDISSLQPVWTYDDGNSSILLPELTMNHDLYGIPNVVEVIYSYGSSYNTAIVYNKDPNSPASIQNRGREIVYRDTQPSLAGYVTPEQLEAYAQRLLRNLSTIKYTVSYTHAYCPVRIGDCVRLNYAKAGIVNQKAKVISQNIRCGLPCQFTGRRSSDLCERHRSWLHSCGRFRKRRFHRRHGLQGNRQKAS
jgi:hypothetical protein